MTWICFDMDFTFDGEIVLPAGAGFYYCIFHELPKKSSVVTVILFCHHLSTSLTSARSLLAMLFGLYHRKRRIVVFGITPAGLKLKVVVTTWFNEE